MKKINRNSVNNLIYIYCFLFVLLCLSSCNTANINKLDTSKTDTNSQITDNNLQNIPKFQCELKKYLAPYGTLLNEGDWSSSDELSADSLFMFYLQVQYGMYFTSADYVKLYGEEFDLKIIPSNYTERKDGTIIFPQEEVEEVIQKYFDAEVEYIRTASSYNANEQGYNLQQFSLKQALFPSIKNITCNDDNIFINIDIFDDELKPKTKKSYLLTVKVVNDGFHYTSMKSLVDA